ncbi:MAG: TrkA family potassium uptake protein [Erysipelotrichaceae bacterium]
MNIKMINKSDELNVLIIGCGRLGATLANSLAQQNHNVTIVDKDGKAFRKLSDSFGGLTLEGNALDLAYLKEIHMEDYETIVCVTNNDNTNVMVAQIAKKIFHAKHVISRLYDPQRECVYKEYGIETICPAVLSAHKIDNILNRKKGCELYEK